MKYALLVTILLLVIPASPFASTTSVDRDSVWFHDGNWYSQTQLDSAIDRHEEWVRELRKVAYPYYTIHYQDSSVVKSFNEVLMLHENVIDTLFGNIGLRLKFKKDTLCNAEFEDRNLTGVLSYRTTIKNTKFKNDSLICPNFLQSDFVLVNFDSCYIENVAWFGKSFKDVDFMSCTFRGMIDLTEKDFVNESSFIGCRIDSLNYKESKLKNCIFNNITYSYIDFSNATLDSVVFCNCSLKKMDFNASKLKNIDFRNKDIQGIKLDWTNLETCSFSNANMKGVIYETRHHPYAKDIAFAKNLDHLTFNNTSKYLFELKALLKSEGFTHASKKVNTAIRRHEDSFLEKALLGITCEYGSNYLLALMWIFYISIIGAIFNIFSIIYDKGKRGIAFRSNISLQDPWEEKWEHHGIKFNINNGSLLGKILSILFLFLKAYGISLVFSTRFGFKDFSLSNWVKRLFPYEFDIRSRGWIRVVHGLQSLFCIYLLALVIVSYFTNIFDIG